MNQVTLNNKDYKKVAGLESLNMFKGQLYETIVTTQNGELVKNAAPIGFKSCGDSSRQLRPHPLEHIGKWRAYCQHYKESSCFHIFHSWRAGR